MDEVGSFGVRTQGGDIVLEFGSDEVFLDRGAAQALVGELSARILALEPELEHPVGCMCSGEDI